MDLTEIGAILTARTRPAGEEVADDSLQRAQRLVKSWERFILTQLSRISEMESAGDTHGVVLGEEILQTLVRSHKLAVERLLRLMREATVTAMVASLASADTLAPEAAADAWMTFTLLDRDSQKSCIDYARRQSRQADPRIAVAADVLDVTQELATLCT